MFCIKISISGENNEFANRPNFLNKIWRKVGNYFQPVVFLGKCILGKKIAEIGFLTNSQLGLNKVLKIRLKIFHTS